MIQSQLVTDIGRFGDGMVVFLLRTTPDSSLQLSTTIVPTISEICREVCSSILKLFIQDREIIACSGKFVYFHEEINSPHVRHLSQWSKQIQACPYMCLLTKFLTNV